MEDGGSKLAILAGGGPAPGINSVIGAAAIRSILVGTRVVGIQDGFSGLMRGDLGVARELTIEEVSRIHFRGGSRLGISRKNPTTDPAFLEATVDSLVRLGVDKLITIGGEDTCFSAMKVEEAGRGRLRVVHVPKTIDNDLDLPLGIPTFGYQTARHVGVDIVRTLMVDAQTTSRWYLVVAMGRKAGHLALGIGKAAGATLTIIPEEFPEGGVRVADVAEMLVGSIVKRLSHGRGHGVAVLAEGIVERLVESDPDMVLDAERDEHGHVRLAEVDLGNTLKRVVRKRLAELGIEMTIVAKDIGYELRCADPIPFDMEYTRDLGYLAARHLLDGGSAVMVSIQNGHFVPLPFVDMVDSATGKAKVRLADIESDSYRIARHYMIRLNEPDLDDPETLAKIAGQTNLEPAAFAQRFRNAASRR